MSDNKLATKQDLKNMYDRMYPYLGGMPEVLANKFSKGDIYSTDEKMIGQWHDGKPLYQKVINLGNLPNTTAKSVAHNISNVETIFIKDGFAKTATDDFNTLPYLRIDNSNFGIEITVNLANVVIKTYADRSSWIGYAILQYTKTTDSPISIGNDTDYSTEEKIIGTWIDGKPIWQRTVALETITLATTYSFNIESWNMDKMLNVWGIGDLYHDNENQGRINFPSAGTGTYNQIIYVKGNIQGTAIVIYSAKASPSSTQTIKNGYLTVQYTKTTD